MTQTQAKCGQRRNQRMRHLIAGFDLDPPAGWQALARCRDADPEVFALEDADTSTGTSVVAGLNRQRHAEARWYCEHCPVLAACLGYALRHELPGTWGGELFTAADWIAARKVRKELEEGK